MSSGNFGPGTNTDHDSFAQGQDLVTGLPQDLDGFFDEFFEHAAQLYVDQDETSVEHIDAIQSPEDITEDAAREVVRDYLAYFFNLDTSAEFVSDFDADYSSFIVLGAGGAGCRLGATGAGTLNEQGVLGAVRDDVTGEYRFAHEGLFNNVDIGLIDTDEIRHKLRRLIDDDNARFGQCLLDAFWPPRDGGAGRNPRRFIQWLFGNPEILQWVISGLRNEGFSVEKVLAGLGGGTGSGLVAGTLELAEMGLIGTGPGAFGYSLVTAEYGDYEDIYALTPNATRSPLDDIVETLGRVAEALDDGTIDYAFYTPNTWLGLHRYFSGENLSYDRIHALVDPVREQRDPIPVAERCQDSTIQQYMELPEVNDEFRHLEFVTDLLFQRPDRAEFSRGIVDHDVTDMAGVLSGHMWARGMHGVQDFSALEGLDPMYTEIEGHRHALYVAGRLSAAKLAADVPTDRIYKTYSVVYAPNFQISRGDLRVVERAVGSEFDLQPTAQQAADPVEAVEDSEVDAERVSGDGDGTTSRNAFAVELDGVGDRVPGDDELRVWTFAAHELPVDVLEALQTPAFQEVVQ